MSTAVSFIVTAATPPQCSLEPHKSASYTIGIPLRWCQTLLHTTQEPVAKHSLQISLVGAGRREYSISDNGN